MFEDKKYMVIRNAISYELANFGYNYLILKREASKWMRDNNYISKFTQVLVHGKINKFLIPILAMVIFSWKR